MSSEQILCYNKGCGVNFDPNTNSDDSCCFHPGAPIFHDAYKGWSCCNKRSTDFTTFLNTKGCTKGRHNHIKPEEPVKKAPPPPGDKDEIIVVEAPKPSKLNRADFISQLSILSTTVSQSLARALEVDKEKENKEEKEIVHEPNKKIGEPCKNNACKAAYEGEHSDLEMCQHHPGFPIFHEGMKYWTCCNRKTSDFNTFLEQMGCTSGSHLWVKNANLKKLDCRFDWHQTAAHVVVTIYAKLAQPESSSVEASPLRLRCNIVFGEKCSFNSDWELQGIIDPSQSCVTMAATKVEVKLKKAEPQTWSRLFFPPKKQEINTQEDQAKTKIDPDLDVGAIDLDDI